MTHSPLIPGFNWTHRTDAYGTHQPVLFEAIKRKLSPLPILELGCGFNSTLLIHSAAGDTTVITVESDNEWLKKFSHLETETRQFNIVGSLDDIIHRFKGQYSVVFIDQGKWESRASCVVHFNLSAEIVVLHDSDYLERELHMNFSDHYKYVKTFMPLEPFPYMTGPPTTIMSNYVDVTKWEINYEDYK